MHSNHECDLTIPGLPPPAAEVHIVPGLAHASLISIKKLINAGCNVHFDKDCCSILYIKH